MGKPIAASTQMFEQDQRHTFTAYYWPVTTTAVRVPGPETADYTMFGSGVGFAMFDVTDAALRLTTRSEIETALTRSSGKTRAVLGYRANGEYRTGAVPVIYDYWGAGAPVGGSRAKQVLLKYSGYVTRTTTSSTVVFCGQGSVLALVTRAGSGSVEVIAQGALHEPVVNPNLNAISYDTIRTELGYQLRETPIVLNAGDFVEIYYLHNGEAWGGFAAKIIPGGADLSSAAFLTQLREAPVIGTSLISADQSPIAAQPLRYIESAAVKVSSNAIREMELTVLLASQEEPTGYSVQYSREELMLVDNAQLNVRLLRGRTVHLEGGFIAPNGDAETYPRFTGYIDDIVPSEDGQKCVLRCRGFEGKLAEAFDDNQPDRLSYHAFGFVMRDGAAEPVFGLPAFDQWPLEFALTLLAYKAGIDPFSLGLDGAVGSSNPYGRWEFRRSTGDTFAGGRYVSARMLADPTLPIYLERQANYGNVGPTRRDGLAADDPYLFAPEVTQRLYDRARSLADHFGYDFYFNAEGQMVLSGRNNPQYFQHFTRTGPYSTNTADGQTVRTSAVGGVVFQRKHSQGAWSKQIVGHFARLDLYVGVGTTPEGNNGGRIQVLIERNGAGGWETVATTAISTVAPTTDAYYYDDVIRTDGSNAAVFTILQLPFDQYRVTLSPLGPEGAADCDYRLNGVAVFERDPDQTRLVQDGAYVPLSTLANILELTPETNAKEMRNHVVVVGARKATLTDSDKVVNATNPNNPEYEFHVSVAVDPFSIYDPTSPNFVGSRRMTVVFDEKVSDSDMARWLTRTILYRYRTPKTSGTFKHTALPVLEIRDAVEVRDERNRSVYHKLWVTEYTETWSNTEATISVSALANPEIPSYQPREDVDIDALFDHDGDGRGEPAIKLAIDYLNIFGQTVDNSTLSAASSIKAYSEQGLLTSTQVADFISSGSTFQLSAPAIPETIFLSWNWRPGQPAPFIEKDGYSYTRTRALVNNPYRHFFHISSWSAGRRPTLTFTFQEGDGTPGVYDKAYYEFPSSANGQWYVLYDRFTNRVGLNPYYDPYTSEVGNLVRIGFELLVSARVRVSVWDATRSGGQEVPVAWLTRPAEAGDEPDAHWVYMESGLKEFFWDGVDNIGFWNTLQSIDFADEIKGAFGDKPSAVGRGFYAWNDKSTPLTTRIGDLNAANFGPDGAPMFTMGQYGQFYIKVEVLKDSLVRKDLARGFVEPRTVNSHSLPEAGTWHTHDQTYVWTHLPEPSQVAIRIQEWNGAGSWSPSLPKASHSWTAIGAAPNSQASIREGRPVRVTFQPVPRKGVLFMKDVGGGTLAYDNTKTSAKLTRYAHLKATIFDQFWSFSGRPYSGMHPKVTTQTAEQKRLTSRMFHNDDHTIEWEDSDWRSGQDLLDYEWVFDPSLFRKDFNGKGEEALRYGDYEQLESLPGFDTKKQGGAANSARAYLTMAYINYLFYLSASTLDRSGRRQYCLNSWVDGFGNLRGFIDKTKIATSEWQSAADTAAGDKYKIVRHESRGAERYLKRTIFVRQWVEPGWLSGAISSSPVAQFGISSAAQLKFVQPTVWDFALSSGALSGNSADQMLAQYAEPNSGVNRELLRYSTQRRSGSGGSAVVSATLPSGTYDVALPFGLGSWSFTNPITPSWHVHSPSRDFHPYWRYPYMPDWATLQTNYYLAAHASTYLNILESTSSQINHKLRDPAAQENWYGYAFRAGYRPFDFAPRLEKTVEEAVGEDPNKVATALTLTPSDILNMYDLVRQDQLDRWDQFRGVLTRAAYAERSEKEDASYREGSKKKSASVQPVLAGGVYLTNMARYSDYSLAPVHVLEGQNRFAYLHMTDRVTDWFNIQFPSEYVWYSDRFFPVTEEGGALYGFCQSEFTNAFAYLGMPWWTRRNVGDWMSGQNPQIIANQLFFDPGAWVGWKPDATDWGTDPHLRWRELNPVLAVRDGADIQIQTQKHASGGFGPGWPSTGQAELDTTWINATAPGPNSDFIRTNIFDDNLSATRRLRLAVGPEQTVARPLVMNLTLPKRLLGL